LGIKGKNQRKKKKGKVPESGGGKSIGAGMMIGNCGKKGLMLCHQTPRCLMNIQKGKMTQVRSKPKGIGLGLTMKDHKLHRIY